MSTYKQLTREQRYQIYALKKAGHGQMEIADLVGVHKSTISRELQRNRGQRGYRPKQAHHFALAHRHRRRSRIQPQTWQLVAEKLRADWSPEQISGWLRRNWHEPVSHPVTNELGRDEWIYQYVLADKRADGDLHTHLRCQKKRRKRYGSYPVKPYWAWRPARETPQSHQHRRAAGDCGPTPEDRGLGSGHYSREG